MAISISGGASISLPGISIGVGGSTGAPGQGFGGAVSLNTGNLQVGLNGGGLQLGLNAGGISAGVSLPGPAIGLGVSIGSQIGPIAGQTFRPQPIPNFRPALYQMVIRAPAPPFGVVFGYTFPISPANITKTPVALTNVYDVGSPDPNMLGVQRNADIFGQTPPMFAIEGTTGFQYHNTDGYTLTGIDSIIALQNLLQQYAALNQQQVQAQIADPYLLEFYDYYTNDYWQVVPMGPQSVTQDRSRPLLINYSFRFAGLRNLSAPPPPPAADPVASNLGASAPQAVASLRIAVGAIRLHYGPLTLRVN